MATTYLHVTTTGADTKDGTTWAKAMDRAAWVAHLKDTVVADTVYFVKTGTYTQVADQVNRSGTSAGPVRIVGVKAGTINEGSSVVLADWATGDDRPLLNQGAYYWIGGASYQFIAIRSTGTGSLPIAPTQYGVVFQCKVLNTSPTVNRAALEGYDSQIRIVGCEASSSAGYAIYHHGGYGTVQGCYCHDSKTGIYGDAVSCHIFDCVIESCLTGVDVTDELGWSVLGCTIRNCGTGIAATTAYQFSCTNTIITDCLVGALWTTQEDCNFWAFNDFHDNSTDRTLVSSLFGALTDITGDPALTCGIVKGTDGVTDGTGQIFTPTTVDFTGVTTADCLVILGAGTGATLGVYTISSVEASHLHLATSAGASKTGITYGVVKGTDFTLQAGSSCLDAGLDAHTYSGVTV
jgi:hypothetical protein